MLHLVDYRGNACCGFSDSYIVGKKAVSFGAQESNALFLLLVKSELFAVQLAGEAVECVVEVFVVYGFEGIEGVVPFFFYFGGGGWVQSFVKEFVKEVFGGVHALDFEHFAICGRKAAVCKRDFEGVIYYVAPGDIVGELGF